MYVTLFLFVLTDKQAAGKTPNQAHLSCLHAAHPLSTVNPAASEVCDGLDNNCDGSIDEIWDTDSDGFTTCGTDGIAGTTAADCDDGLPCTTDSCDATAGCVNAANTEPCDDGDACTLDDTCAESACVSGPYPN